MARKSRSVGHVWVTPRARPGWVFHRNANLDPMVELVGNKAIESAAIAWVMDLERAAGRQPRDARYEGAPGDVDSPPRVIEVKASGKSNRGYDLWLETRQVEEAKKNPDFYVYVVENVRQGDPAFFTLRVIGGDRLQQLLTRAKEQHHFTVPRPVVCPWSATAARRILGLASVEADQLPKLAQGEGLWRIGQRAFAVRHVCTPAELELLDTIGFSTDAGGTQG